MFLNKLKVFKKIFIFLIIFLVLIELSSFIVLYSYSLLTNKPNSNSILQPQIKYELEKVINSSILTPTRWYSYLPNFSGSYVQTDSSGFRINNANLNHSKSIGFFGGSTMFSVYTTQPETIPDQINIKNFNSLNFGIGGYSTSAELATFIEVQRKYKNIKIAVFYDGVNDVARFLELYEEIKFDNKKKTMNAIFENTGYYYKIGIENSLNQEFFSDKSKISYHSSFLQLIQRVKKKLFYKSSYTEEEINSMSEKITDLYFENLKDISDYANIKKIRVFFIFQPTIFTTKKKLTFNENNIIKNERTVVSDLFKVTHKKILNDKRFKTYNIIDMSNSLNDLKENIFFDWHHLNGVGNKRVAEQIKEIIVKKINNN